MAEPNEGARRPRGGTVRANGLDIAYEERGHGEPVLLLAGIGMQLVSWPEGFLDALAARGLRVIVSDHRDIGRSTWLDEAGVPPVLRLLPRAVLGLPVRAPYTLFDMAADVAGLASALGLARAHVVGVSMGGMVAQALAVTHGERLASLTSMMSHPGGHLLTTGLPHASLKLLAPAPRTRAAAIARQVDFFRTAGSPGFARDDAEIAARAGRAYDRAFHPAGFARHFAAVLATGDLSRRLAHVAVPTLVLHGKADPVIRAARGRETARAIPGAKLQLL
ncbi:MAG: alpha/beta hydrolase, partial [Myxococcales bacterium]|nr:alpha/beta hydrolase [Myxococcales bacterium]